MKQCAMDEKKDLRPLTGYCYAVLGGEVKKIVLEPGSAKKLLNLALTKYQRNAVNTKPLADVIADFRRKHCAGGATAAAGADVDADTDPDAYADLDADTDADADAGDRVSPGDLYD
jgi:hypothetical protein